MRRLSLAVLALGLLGAQASALNTHFFSTANAPVSVSSTKTVTQFLDTQSGGTGAGFQARWVMVRSCGSNTGAGCTAASANTCFFSLGGINASKTLDMPVEPGTAVVISFPPDKNDGITWGWTQITTICNTAETALFRIDAGE